MSIKIGRNTVTQPLPAFAPVQQQQRTQQPFGEQSGFDVAKSAPMVMPQPPPPVLPMSGGNIDIRYQGGFDAAKIDAPLKLGADGTPKSAKYSFAQAVDNAAKQGVKMPGSEAEAEQFFNTYLRGPMAKDGFQVDAVQGSYAFVHTKEDPQGSWVHFMFHPEEKGGIARFNWDPVAYPGGPSLSDMAPAGMDMSDMFAGLPSWMQGIFDQLKKELGGKGMQAGAQQKDREQALAQARDTLVSQSGGKVAAHLDANGQPSLDTVDVKQADGSMKAMKFASNADDLSKAVSFGMPAM